MRHLEFKLSRQGRPLRWLNWKVFVDNSKSVFNKKHSNFCVLFVCCNSFDSFIRCNHFLTKESNQKFDVLVVDNSTDDENIKLFLQLGNKNKKISILRPINNIGGSGGFSIGMEYAIQQEYEFLILFEDDIIPIDNDIISNTIEISNLDSIIFNKNIFLDEGLPFHLNCYPIRFLREYGVVDPRMFLTYDDVQFAGNINAAVKSQKYKKINSDNKYYHPMIKKNSQKCWTIYLSSRNSLMKCISTQTTNNIKEFILGFLMLFYGFSKGLIEGCRTVLYSHIIGVYDFLIGGFGYKYTQDRLDKLFGYTISKPMNVGMSGNILTSDDVEKLTVNRLDLYQKFAGQNVYFGGLKCSHKWIDGVKNGLVIAGFLNNLYPFFVLCNDVIFLEKYDYFEKKYEISYYKSQFNKLNYIKLFFGFLFSIILYIPVYTVVLLKIILKKGIKFLIINF